MVEVLAGILAAEDERRFDAPLLSTAARHPQAIVRRHAALALGRIGDPGATPVLLELLTDRDTTVQQDAAFALGLLRDPAALPTLRDLVLGAPPRSQTATHEEAVTAIAKTGGEAAAVMAAVLERWQPQAGDPPPVVLRVLAESWRLGPDAPLAALAQAGTAPSAAARRWAVYSLSRLRAPGGARVLLAATADRDAEVRQLAVRALSAEFANSAGLSRSGVVTQVRRLVDDVDAGVRINALRALASYRDPALAGAALDHVSDRDPNVRVQALTALGDLGGRDASSVLAAQTDRGLYATRRAALLSLARQDRGAALRKSAGWITGDDWTLRAAGAEALGTIAGDTAIAWLEELLLDTDTRVAGRAYRALARASPHRARAIAPRVLESADPAVRAAAANHLRDDPQPGDVAALVQAFERALNDPIPQARVATIEALGAVAALGFAERVAAEEALLRRVPTADDYLIRRTAARSLPGVASRWGPPFPIETGRDVGDYRDIARTYLLPPPRETRSPGLVVETDRGRITITLFGADAPLTVHALLELADQHYFDGGTWHRVVPNFVIQDGDPRGDGWGGPGFVLRDELNRRRYERGTVGMALDGPDTGGSQFFITFGPQPHLDGTYSVVGRVETGMAVVDRTTEGDRIRTVRRR